MFDSGEKFEINKETGEMQSRTPLTKEERNDLRTMLIEKFGNVPVTFEVTPADSNQVRIGEPSVYTVAGIILSDSSYGTVYLTQSEYDRLWALQLPTFENCFVSTTNYVADPNAIYSVIYAPFSNTDEQKNILWDIHSNKEFDANATRISVGGRYISELDGIDDMVKSMSQVFLYVGLVFALFAILLFSNFISTSISQKRHEIGILRAVGARGTDVFKIFFSESFIIAFICSLLATVSTAILCSVINTAMAAEVGASIFVFGPFSIIIVIATAILTAILATFVPVWLAARKKPVESIRAI